MSTLHIVSPASAEYRFLADITEPNKLAYAAKWNLSCSFPLHHGADDDMMWQRIQFMLDGLDGHEWILFMGADTAVTNIKVNPMPFLRKDADLIVAVDENGLQSDVMFIRNCEETKQWLRDVMAQRGIERCEQDAMSKVLGGAESYPAYRAAFHIIEEMGLEQAHGTLLNETGVRVKILHKKRINSTISDWTPGDFIFHAAAMEREARIAKLKELTALENETTK